jgi:hypothetical protein
MKFLISESQYNWLLSEQSSPVRIGCRDYDKIGQLCTTLVFPKAEADKLIAKFKPNADKEASEQINKLVQSLTSMGGEEGERIAQKFSEAIASTKGQIQKILTKYYSQAMYASCGLGPKLNASSIILEICGVIYSQFIKSWNDSFFMRNAARLAITANNIKQVQSEGKKILSTVISEISNTVDFYFQDSTSFHVQDRVYELEKTSPKCTKVIVTQDKGCNNLPKQQWYNPKQKYKNIDSPTITKNAEQLAMNTYSPKLVAFLNNLV